MNKMEFVSETLKTYKKKDLSKRQIMEVLDAAFRVMGKTIQKEKRFSYAKFGSFTLKKRKSRDWLNPVTKEVVSVKSMKTVGFKPALAFKRSLNGSGKTAPKTLLHGTGEYTGTIMDQNSPRQGL